MNLKTLRKKIRKLENRLQEGPAKLARWKSKLAAMEKAKAEKAKRKSAAQVAKVSWRSATGAKSPETKKKPSAISTPAKAAAPGSKPAAKAKRQLNLSPERRAQLSAAMKVRWAAKRAAAETNPQNGSSDPALPAS